MPDNFWLGGSVGRPVISDTVERTLDRALYSKHRYGNFSYAIPVDDGEYALTLHFAESYWGRENEGGGGTGSRVFDVFCNGEALVRKLDIYKEPLRNERSASPESPGRAVLASQG
jgi:hypothetical protein